MRAEERPFGCMLPAMGSFAHLRRIGFWTTRPGDGLPDPRTIQSPTWERGRREVIGGYLAGGTVISDIAPLHECLICGVAAGFRERTDGVWWWPEGLAHYVVAHGVKLPAEFIQTMARLEFSPPRLDVARLRRAPAAVPTVSAAQAGPAPGFVSADAARALDDMVGAKPTSIYTAPPKPALTAAARQPDLDDATEAIPVPETWTVNVEGVHTKTPVVLFDRPIVLGRDRGCDLVLEHRSVSRRHVRLVPWRDRVIAQDLGSSNGLVVRGARHGGQVELRAGDKLALGQATLSLVLEKRRR